jgi:16S rRNA (adenine1518-N6/adenine1519-N6)-dimethyltransferase
VTKAEVREILDRAGVVPSRRLGQNFLCDPNLARSIAGSLEAEPEDCVVEVGPGTGALTEQLVGKVRRLVLVEYDARLVEVLEDRFGGREGVEVHHADAARFDVRALFKQRPVRLLGNLPYSAGGAIMKNFLSRPSPLAGAVLMLQQEVVGRLMARPRSKEYGVLTLRVQSDWEIEVLRDVPPEVFFPRPKVESTVVRLVPRRGPLPVFDHQLFDSLVRRGFAQRRKQLRKQLPADCDWPELAAAIGVPETARAEELALEQWVELTRMLDPHPLSDCAQREDEQFDVVDEDDRVLRQAGRGEVHREGWMHRAVHIFLFNRRGELFLQRRSRLKDVHPGLWDSSAAGHLDAGEDYLPAAVRELEEELGVGGASLEQVGSLAACRETGWEHVRLFRAEHFGGRLRWPCSEIDAGLWLAPEEVEAWARARPGDFAGGFLKCWEVYNKNR